MKILPLLLIAACAAAADLSGNWVVVQDMHDGTERRTYFDLKQDGDHITGHIRVTQFYYAIKDSKGGPDSFTVTASMMDGHNERTVTYQGKLQGDQLVLTTAGRGGAPGAEMTAHRTAAGEGAYPKRVELPTLHKVSSNGLAKTPPMGWNSWNKFHGRVDDASVRGIADVIASNGMKDAGYIYVNIDDTWEGSRDDAGNIRSNTKFPDMKALADYVHSKGLKLGIYSSPGPNTCAGYEGTYGHEAQDAKSYAAW
ncbi:MAG TPA: glycoside hydrolase family 27 protein, partial [Bryobacteraceae bacterium]|nr:glycoside hydrolase family 27 protein [Bryobacteraceae bacterium]